MLGIGLHTSLTYEASALTTRLTYQMIAKGVNVCVR